MENQKIRGKKVLVTGAAGFIGSNIVKVLLQQDNIVVGLDNLATGRIQNIAAFIDTPNFTFVKGDITNLETCLETSKGVDIILHQAALGSVSRSIDNPIATNEANVSGFLNILWATKENNVKRLVYAASSSTYGDHPDLPKKEEKIGKPLSPYAVTKYVNELYAKVFADTYGIEAIGLRYFNVFGPNQDPNGAYAAVIPKFINLLLNEQSPTINGDGSHSRDFTYIENVVHVNQLAALTENKDALNTIYNVACAEHTTLNELVTIIKANLKEIKNDNFKDVQVHYGAERKGDVKHSLADISKAAHYLGYAPKVKFSEGIKHTIKSLM